MTQQKQWLNYHHLFYFKTIAVEGGIAKAAQKLRLGQPTLSTQLKQFEDAIGHTLFDRTKRKLQLTEAGRLILGYANEIFRMGDEMLDAVSDQLAQQRIQVQIGVTDMVSKHLTLKIFSSAQKNASCQVSLTEGTDADLLKDLRTHRLDLVVANHSPPLSDASGFYARCVAKMPVLVCGASKFASLRRGFPQSLQGQPCILPSPQSKLRQEFANFLKGQDIDVHVVAEVQDTGVQKLLGAGSHGLMPIAQSAAEDLLKSKELVEIGTLPDISEELWLIAGQRRIQNPIAAAIMRDFKL